MPPFRPANLNKRAYPGNASIIGPTCTTTVGFTTTICCTCISQVCASPSEILSLGCRCAAASCPFCHCCCCCVCTVCDRTIPSGRWKASEQYEARTRDSWGDDSCSNAPQIGYCSACCGTCCSTGTDYKGFFICDSGTKWFVAPSCTEITTSWYDRCSAATCACSLMGNCGWFIPSCGQLKNPGSVCRSYWDSYSASNYWSDTELSAPQAWFVSLPSGSAACYYGPVPKTGSHLVRSFRTI